MAVIFHEPFVPAEVLRVATMRALELRRPVMSDDLLLLALSELHQEEPARRALEAAGVSAERLLAEVRKVGDPTGGQSDVTRVSFPPRMYSLAGLAWGFAAALGDGQVKSEHVLLAILWRPTGAAFSVLRCLGVDRESVMSQLERLGVAIPASGLPAAGEIDWGERVWIERDQLARVLDYLRGRLAPDTEWGFNYEGERAWVQAHRTVDLRALCAAALSQQAE